MGNFINKNAKRLALLTVQAFIVMIMILFWKSILGRIFEAFLLATTVIGFVEIVLDFNDYFKKWTIIFLSSGL